MWNFCCVCAWFEVFIKWITKKNVCRVQTIDVRCATLLWCFHVYVYAFLFICCASVSHFLYCTRDFQQSRFLCSMYCTMLCVAVHGAQWLFIIEMGNNKLLLVFISVLCVQWTKALDNWITSTRDANKTALNNFC